MSLNFTNLEATINAKLNSLTATVTAASAAGGTVTYTANNAFAVGQTITITGLSTAAFNLQGVTVATKSPTQFTVTNAATGTAVTGASGVATIIVDSKELLIQMKALEAATQNLSLGKVVAEGLYQQGLIQTTANSALSTYNETTATATAQINALIAQLGGVNTQAIIDLVTTKLAEINSATTTAINNISSAASTAQTTAVNAVSAQQTTSVNAVTSAQTTATNAITSAQSTAVSAVSTAGTNATNSATSAITTAKDAAIVEINTALTGTGAAQISVSLNDLDGRLDLLEANSPQALIYALTD
jgi:hypothetical protein